MIRIKLSKTIAFNPELVKIFGDVEKALFIQQLVFWNDKGKREDGFIYKTADELQEETGLTRYQQKRCRDFFKTTGTLEEKLKKANGVPTLHFRINEQKLQQIIDEYENGLVDNSNLKKLQNPFATNLQTQIAVSNNSITENTTENTTENNKDFSATKKTLRRGISSDLKEEKKEERSSPGKKKETAHDGGDVGAEAKELVLYFHKQINPDIPIEFINFKKEITNAKQLVKKKELRYLKRMIELIKEKKTSSKNYYWCNKCSTVSFLLANLLQVWKEINERR